MRPFRLSLCVAAVVASAACGSDSSNTPGSASGSSLAFTVQPTDIAPAGVITPSVKVAIRDSYGATVTSSSSAVTVALGTNPGGTLSGTLTRNAVSGIATFDNLGIDNAGTGYTLVATSGALTGATSGAFDVVGTGPGPTPVKVAFVVQPSNVLQGTSITPAVKVAVQDANGATVATSNPVTIAIGTNPSAGTLTGTLTVNAVSGVATFANLSIDNAGVGYTLTAASTGLSGATSNAFDITAPSPVPLAITITTVSNNYRSVRNNSTHPAVDSLKVTGTATWTNLLNGIHLVESTGSPSFTTQAVGAASYVITFNTTGTYQYDCSQHGSGMDGRIEVVP